MVKHSLIASLLLLVTSNALACNLLHRELGNAVIKGMAAFIVLMGKHKILISNNMEQRIIPPLLPR